MVSQLCGQCCGETVLLLFSPLSNEPWWRRARFKIDLLQLTLFPRLDIRLFPSLLCCTGTFSSRLRCVEGNLQNYTLSLLKQYLHNIKQITSGCQHVPASKHTSRRGRWPRIHQRRRRQDCWAEWGKWLLVVIVFPANIPQQTAISTATAR